MYKTIEDFIEDWKEESKSTVMVFKKVDDLELKKKVHDNVRTPGKIAWHITQTVTEMPKSAGIISTDPLENMDIPESIKTITDLYEKYSGELVRSIKENWKDSDLNEVIELYGQKWKRSKVLSVLLKHEIHHRAQMTVVMRLLNMKVPGVYGPSKEEWAKYGADPQE